MRRLQSIPIVGSSQRNRYTLWGYAIDELKAIPQQQTGLDNEKEPIPDLQAVPVYKTKKATKKAAQQANFHWIESELPDPIVDDVVYSRLPQIASSDASGSIYSDGLQHEEDASSRGSSAFVAAAMEQRGHEPDLYR